MISEKDGRVSGLYVWVQLKSGPVVAGRFDRKLDTGVFFYANSYIERPDAFALDPVNLPLIGKREFLTRANKGHFGVLLDAGPDGWGEKVLTEVSKSRPRNKLEYLLAGNGQGVGQLMFSLSSSAIKMPSPQVFESVDLALIEEAARAIETNRPVASDLLPDPVRRVLEDSSWIGGARPKAGVVFDGKQHLAKFSRSADSYDQVAAEYASLSLAKMAGFTVPNFRLRQIADGRRALLVERFDFDGEGRRLHYISAHALLNLEKARQDNPEHGYPGVAIMVKRFCEHGADDARELFRRMALRVLIGDTDDHARNHGFLFQEGNWSLAPVFDLLPHPGNTEFQAMPIGEGGRIRSLENLLSMSEIFGLNAKAAQAEVTKIATRLQGWRAVFLASGVPRTQLRLFEPGFALVHELAQKKQSEPDLAL